MIKGIGDELVRKRSFHLGTYKSIGQAYSKK